MISCIFFIHFKCWNHPKIFLILNWLMKKLFGYIRTILHKVILRNNSVPIWGIKKTNCLVSEMIFKINIKKVKLVHQRYIWRLSTKWLIYLCREQKNMILDIFFFAFAFIPAWQNFERQCRHAPLQLTWQ